MSDPRLDRIAAFYAAFTRHDAVAMGACYDDDVRFSDPVFPDLRGDDARGMWRMLCARGEAAKLRIDAGGFRMEGDTGHAHWEADYVFTTTGRPIHNVIDATFTFRGDRIATHTDRFDLRRWCGMALGPVGVLLGWLPPLQSTVRRRADGELRKFLAREAKRGA